MTCRRLCAWCALALFISMPTAAISSELSDPESAIRRMVRANAEKDLPTLSRLMAHDADIISYAVAGRDSIVGAAPLGALGVLTVMPFLVGYRWEH